MTHSRAVERVVDLLDPAKNVLFNATTEQARAWLAEGDVEAVRRLDGHFASQIHVEGAEFRDGEIDIREGMTVTLNMIASGATGTARSAMGGMPVR